MSINKNPMEPPEVPPALREAFADPESRGHGTFVFIDQTNSVGLKASLPEAAWLPQLGYMYDVISSVALRRCRDVHMKFLGDGVLLAYDGDDCGLVAIETAIEVMETISNAGTAVDGAMGSISFNMSIGIASGSAHRFRAPNGTIDHVGMVVDKSARLCAAASSKAIFIDKPTAAATNFLKVRSEMGKVFNRTADEYAGERQTAVLKGLPLPVEYHEILWERQLFGIKSELVTDAANERQEPARTEVSAAAEPVVHKTTPTRVDKQVGVVKYWSDENRFGFVVGRTGEEFYCSPNLLVYPEDATEMSPGVGVAFVAIDAIADGKSRRASALLVEGQYADGALVVPPTKDRPHGWIEVRDSSGNGQLVYVAADEVNPELERGSVVNFRMMVTPKGAKANDVARAGEADAA